MMKSIFFFLLILLCVGSNIIAQNTEKLSVALGGNSYITHLKSGARINDEGISRWNNKETVISAYIYLEEKGKYPLYVSAKGNGAIKVSQGGRSARVEIDSEDFQTYEAGHIEVKKPGYIHIDLQGLTKKGDTFGDVKELIIQGYNGKAVFVRDFSYYWGRRGPSVHLNYMMPEGEDIEWFYNEVTVPEDGEIMGSYYMANGFGEGYFGIQYNSDTERRVLFSVWSPYNTQDLKMIPEEFQVKVLRRGEGVNVGEFGNEGSGGQSYLKYNWKAGTTYKFLTQVKPDGEGNTIYTAYFYATDEGRWRLIASFLRPKTDTWYKRAHSFLENFSAHQGYLTRWVKYNNQWVKSKDGNWTELTEANFTYDNTARAGVRLDYQGGLTIDGYFYLKNCGFFFENTEYNSKFNRPASNVNPVIDFDMLENLGK
ncbi:MAG: DUF3472 domain-containing protein [Odoribacter sp.]|nr:DUF3472 domain-containing protein [Odoribacter sp.]